MQLVVIIFSCSSNENINNYNNDNNSNNNISNRNNYSNSNGNNNNNRIIILEIIMVITIRMGSPAGGAPAFTEFRHCKSPDLCTLINPYTLTILILLVALLVV